MVLNDQKGRQIAALFEASNTCRPTTGTLSLQLRTFDLTSDFGDPCGAVPGRSQSSPAPVLRERLFDLLEAAGIMQLSVPERGVQLGLAQQLAAIDRAAQGFALGPDLVLAERLRCGLHGLKAMVSEPVPPGLGSGDSADLPDALLVLPASTANARALYFDHRSPLQVGGGIAGVTGLEGPYLALVECVRDFTGRLAARRGFVQAVFSRDWLVPVESQLERETLQLLMALQDRLDDHGLHCAIARSRGPVGSAPCLEFTFGDSGELMDRVKLSFDGAHAARSMPKPGMVRIGPGGLSLTQIVSLFEARIKGHSTRTSAPETHI